MEHERSRCGNRAVNIDEKLDKKSDEPRAAMLVLGTQACADGNLNPYLHEEGVKRVMDLTVGVMLTTNRLGNLMRCGAMAQGLLGMLQKLQAKHCRQLRQGCFGLLGLSD